MNAGEPEKILEISEFSMLRLQDIGEQRKLFSSVDDIPYAHDSDSDFDQPQDKRNTGRVLQYYDMLKYHYMLQQAQLGVPHSEIQVKLD